VYSTEKTLAELSDKVTPELKGSVETALEGAKKALEANDGDQMQAALKSLEEVSHKLAEEAYKKAAAEGGEAQAGAEQSSEASKDDDVVDADYEEVQDSK